MDEQKKCQKQKTEFICKDCDFKCFKNSNLMTHFLTRRHKIRMGLVILENKQFICDCGKSYKHMSSLCNHKKNCAKLENNSTPPEKPPSMSMNLILDILQQNQEFKNLIVEQNKQMMELVKEGKTINNTTNNNKFNLNIFLNEKCKDAMNIMDFANSLEIQLKELEDVGTLGYATGISNIIVRGLHELDIYKRPIHCSDLKRESIHVKDQNMWILDKEKTLLETAIKRVARKNILKVKDWKDANPEYSEINSKTMDKYTQILIEATGSFEPTEKERVMNKIIHTIAKEVLIDK